MARKSSAKTSRRSAAPLVADTGPLLALARVGMLPVLARLYRPILIPRSVRDECLAKPRAADGKAVARAIRRRLLLVRKPKESPDDLARLHAGESDAIRLAIETGAPLLIDERFGRTVAARLGVPVTGTVGVLVEARRRGLIRRAAPVMETLVRSGYFLAPALVAAALAQLREAPSSAAKK